MCHVSLCCCCSPFPSKKAITLLKSEPFSVSLSYDAADARIPPHFSKQLGTYTVELPKVGRHSCSVGHMVQLYVPEQFG